MLRFALLHGFQPSPCCIVKYRVEYFLLERSNRKSDTRPMAPIPMQSFCGNVAPQEFISGFVD